MGKYSEKQKQWTENYKRENYKRIPLDVPKEFHNQVKAAAEAAGQSVNGYIKQAIIEKVERDRSK